jgi:DNA-binding GntR family transcriptional regulator
LSRDLGWARQTCSKALRLLVREKLLTCYDGLGYHVSQRAPAGLDLAADDATATTPW